MTKSGEHTGNHSEILLTQVPEVGQVHFENESGEMMHPPVHLPHRRNSIFAFDILSEMYIAIGPGTHDLAKIKDKSGVKPHLITASARTLLEVMPSYIITEEMNNKGKRTALTLGRIALATRRATPEEKERQQQEVTAAFLSKREELLAADREKIDLTTYDHALVRVRDKGFSIQLDTPEAILAARMLEAISKIMSAKNAPVRLTRNDIAKPAWQCMPVPERSLFTNDDDVIFGQSASAINDASSKILEELTNRLKITRRMGASHAYDITGSDIDVEVMVAPPEASYSADIAPIFPPGTDKEEVGIKSRVEHSESELSNARDKISMALDESTSLSQPDALDLLYTVMTREGKHTLSAALKKMKAASDIETIVALVHTRALRSLGYASYWSARDDYTIARNNVTGSTRIRQVSGNLPGTTFRHVTSTTSNWRVGT